MFVAMNRFRIAPGAETAFEDVWRNRKSRLDQVAGFQSFHLLKGPQREDHTLYASHTVWDSRESFEAWTRSDHFRAAHAQAGDNRGMYLGHPEMEGFTAVEGA